MELDDVNIIGMAQKAVGKGICDRCLGRCFAKVSTNMDNAARGRFLRERLGVAEVVPPSSCTVCEGLFDELSDLAAAVERNFKGIEFSTFLIGSKVDQDILVREQALWKELGTEFGEVIKTEVNREVGKLVEASTGKVADFKKPEVVALLDTRYNSVSLEAHSLFLYGRYLKMERGIPQTMWNCRQCRGKGCKNCGGTGKMYPTSVEELIGGPLMQAAGGNGVSFHGMGREDIDARMLGNGRPFVLEVAKPSKRKIDLEALTKEINATASGRVEVRDLRPSDRDEVIRIKGSTSEKTYCVKVACETSLDDGNAREKLKELEAAFRGKLIYQETPIRVVHRRADLERERRVVEVRITEVDGNARGMTLEVRGQSGLYIKELVNGDDGRTKPSISSFLGVKCKVDNLDVIQVHDGPKEGSGEGADGGKG